MEMFNQEFIEDIIRLTWRNPAFMAVAIALVWLIPQLFIRKIMEKNMNEEKYKFRKIKFRSFIPPILLNKIFIYNNSLINQK